MPTAVPNGYYICKSQKSSALIKLQHLLQAPKWMFLGVVGSIVHDCYDLNGIQFKGACLYQASFDNANLEKADFTNFKLIGPGSFSSANLKT